MYRDDRFNGDDDFIEFFEGYEGHDEGVIVEDLDGKMTRIRRVDEDVDPVTGAGQYGSSASASQQSQSSGFVY